MEGFDAAEWRSEGRRCSIRWNRLRQLEPRQGKRPFRRCPRPSTLGTSRHTAVGCSNPRRARRPVFRGSDVGQLRVYIHEQRHSLTPARAVRSQSIRSGTACVGTQRRSEGRRERTNTIHVRRAILVRTTGPVDSRDPRMAAARRRFLASRSRSASCCSPSIRRVSCIASSLSSGSRD